MKEKQQFRRCQRLTTKADYEKVFRSKRSTTGKYWQVLAANTKYKYARLGLAISKKVLKKAVARNLYKRIAREVFRLNQHSLAAMDFVVMAKQNHKTKEQRKILHQELLTLLTSYDKSN